MKTLTHTKISYRVWSLVIALGIIVFATSCGEDDPISDTQNSDLPSEVSFEVDVESEAGMEAVMEDLDVVAEAGMDAINAGGRQLQDDRLDCAIVTHDEDSKTVTIDYGDGCEGPHGRVRSGIIVITYTDRKLVPGSVKTVTLQNFSVDTVRVEGTRIITNIMETEEDAPKFRVELIGGKMTFPDETSATRDADHTREWFRGTNPRLDESYRLGTAEGTDRDGNTYRVEILERIVYKRTCGLLPVSGIKQITVNGGEHVIVYDYGDGRCDNLVTVTIDGRTEEIEVNPRRFKKRPRG